MNHLFRKPVMPLICNVSETQDYRAWTYPMFKPNFAAGLDVSVVSEHPEDRHVSHENA
jgi:hypothetical protein